MLFLISVMVSAIRRFSKVKGFISCGVSVYVCVYITCIYKYNYIYIYVCVHVYRVLNSFLSSNVFLCSGRPIPPITGWRISPLCICTTNSKQAMYGFWKRTIYWFQTGQCPGSKQHVLVLRKNSVLVLNKAEFINHKEQWQADASGVSITNGVLTCICHEQMSC